jgi:hypothetical protein
MKAGTDNRMPLNTKGMAYQKLGMPWSRIC